MSKENEEKSKIKGIIAFVMSIVTLVSGVSGCLAYLEAKKSNQLSLTGSQLEIKLMGKTPDHDNVLKYAQEICTCGQCYNAVNESCVIEDKGIIYVDEFTNELGESEYMLVDKTNPASGNNQTDIYHKINLKNMNYILNLKNIGSLLSEDILIRVEFEDFLIKEMDIDYEINEETSNNFKTWVIQEDTQNEVDPKTNSRPYDFNYFQWKNSKEYYGSIVSEDYYNFYMENYFSDNPEEILFCEDDYCDREYDHLNLYYEREWKSTDNNDIKIYPGEDKDIFLLNILDELYMSSNGGKMKISVYGNQSKLIQKEYIIRF